MCLITRNIDKVQSGLSADWQGSTVATISCLYPSLRMQAGDSSGVFVSVNSQLLSLLACPQCLLQTLSSHNKEQKVKWKRKYAGPIGNTVFLSGPLGTFHGSSWTLGMGLAPRVMDDTAGRLARQNYSVSFPQVLVSCISIISLFEIFSAAAAAKSLQSCPTLCNPTDGSPPGLLIPGIL